MRLTSPLRPAERRSALSGVVGQIADLMVCCASAMTVMTGIDREDAERLEWGPPRDDLGEGNEQGRPLPQESMRGKETLLATRRLLRRFRAQSLPVHARDECREVCR